jgi:hypothetical protein
MGDPFGPVVFRVRFALCACGKGLITVISDDDEHLKDFEEYMP